MEGSRPMNALPTYEGKDKDSLVLVDTSYS